MKKLAIFFWVFVSMSLPVLAQAEWTLLRSSQSGTDFYYQKKTLKKDSGISYVTVLVNTNPTAFNDVIFQSDVSRKEVNCKLATLRSVHLQLYSERFAQGNLLYVSPVSGQPTIIVPDSWMDDLYNVACSGAKKS